MIPGGLATAWAGSKPQHCLHEAGLQACRMQELQSQWGFYPDFKGRPGRPGSPWSCDCEGVRTVENLGNWNDRNVDCLLRNATKLLKIRRKSLQYWEMKIFLKKHRKRIYKGKIGKMDTINIKNFCFVIYIGRKMNSQATDWENITFIFSFYLITMN